MLHHGTEHPRWGKVLRQIGNRNLIQVRMDPDFSATMGITTFDTVFNNADSKRILFDESIWLPQNQECPETGFKNCPDCGGTGDLRDSIGRFSNIRII